MAIADLPTNVDATYEDTETDPSRKVHQQHHDTIHAGLQDHEARLADTITSTDVTSIAVVAEGAAGVDPGVLYIEVPA